MSEVPAMRRRIALVCNSSWAMVNFRMAVMKALRDDGHELVVIAPDDGGREALERENIRFRSWNLRTRGTNPFRELAALTTLRRALREERPELALCYTIKPAIYGSLVGPSYRVRTYAIITGLGYAFLAPGLKSAVARALYRLALRRAEEAWFLNEDDQRLFMERGLVREGEGQVLPGEGVDGRRFAPLPPRQADGKTVFLMVSRLLRDKGVGEYLEAARTLRAERPDAIFRLAGPFGDGGPGAVPPEEISALERGGVVEYLGRLEDVRPAIAEADYVVLPSYREGIPRALLEAACMGKPLVATDVPGCREVAREGVNAFLAEPRDAASLSEALRRALETPTEAAGAMGKRGRDAVLSNFGDEAVVDAYRRRLKRSLSPESR